MGVVIEEDTHQIRTGDHAKHLALFVTDDNAFDAVALHHIEHIMQVLFGPDTDHILYHMLCHRCIRGFRFAMMRQVAEQGLFDVVDVPVPQGHAGSLPL